MCHSERPVFLSNSGESGEGQIFSTVFVPSVRRRRGAKTEPAWLVSLGIEP
jgi:hypothetical protein